MTFKVNIHLSKSKKMEYALMFMKIVFQFLILNLKKYIFHVVLFELIQDLWRTEMLHLFQFIDFVTNRIQQPATSNHERRTTVSSLMSAKFSHFVTRNNFLNFF